MVLALLLLLAQDAETRQLSDPDPAVRAAADRALRRMGSLPLDALRRAQEHVDPEVRGRVIALLAHAERELAQETREREQRPAAMKRLAADFPPVPGSAATDGALFSVKHRPWKDGTIYESSVEKVLEGRIEWDVASVSGAAVERCAIHSPRLVFVPGPPPESPKILLRGLRRWLCETPIVFKDPRNGDTWRRGGVELSVHWPELIVKLDAPLPADLLEETLSSSDIRIVLRDPSDAHDSIGGGGGGGGRYGSLLGKKRLAEPVWCGCDGAPTKINPEIPKTARERAVRAPHHEKLPLDRIAELRLSFRKPVEEPFELGIAPSK